jgi:hypothetical protein
MYRIKLKRTVIEHYLVDADSAEEATTMVADAYVVPVSSETEEEEVLEAEEVD